MLIVPILTPQKTNSNLKTVAAVCTEIEKLNSVITDVATQVKNRVQELGLSAHDQKLMVEELEKDDRWRGRVARLEKCVPLRVLIGGDSPTMHSTTP